MKKMTKQTTFFKTFIIIASVFSFLTFTKLGLSENLLQIYRDAAQNDPTFQSAREQYLATTEAYPQARSQLLPSLQLNSQVTWQHYESSRDRFDPFGATIGFNNLTTGQYALTLTQPIFNFANIANISVAKEQIRQAAAVYASAAQDLMLRVAQAYFKALLAQDNLRFTEAEKSATGRQLDQAKQRYEVGLDAITSVYEAQASYDAIVAKEIAAKNDVSNTYEGLRQITGKYYSKISRLKNDIPLLSPKPTNVETWVISATGQNLELIAARYGARAAKEKISTNFAGHYPTLNSVTNFQAVRASNVGPGSQGTTTVFNTGVQLALPIYQGGLVQSQTRQAMYSYQKATADMETTYRQIMVDTRQTFNNVLAGISKVKADKQTIVSSQSSYDSTDAALKVGTRTIVDLLIVQQKLFEAQRNLAQDQYQYLVDSLSLKKLTGLLNITDIQKINSWLTDAPYKNIRLNNTSDDDEKQNNKTSHIRQKKNPPSKQKPLSQAKLTATTINANQQNQDQVTLQKPVIKTHQPTNFEVLKDIYQKGTLSLKQAQEKLEKLT